MNDAERILLFKKAIKYRNIGSWVILIACVVVLVYRNWLSFILGIIILTIGVSFVRQYRCPECKLVFNPKVKSKDLIVCPRCTRRLQE